MGLDQYLYAKKYYSSTEFWGKENAEMFEKIVDAANMRGFTHKNDENFNSVYVEVQCAYWRKANQIHAWFVNNVQDGNDNCAEYYVSREKLQQLVDECEAVIKDKDKAEEILPTQSGFFFGNTEYDDWYMHDIQYTAERLRELIQLGESESVEFYYSSSW